MISPQKITTLGSFPSLGTCPDDADQLYGAETENTKFSGCFRDFRGFVVKTARHCAVLCPLGKTGYIEDPPL